MPVHLTTADIGVSVLAPDGDGSALTGVGGMAADTGWVANSTVGDKTQVVSAYDSIPMFSGADTINISDLIAMGQQLQAVTRKLCAMQTTLAANLRPNA